MKVSQWHFYSQLLSAVTTREQALALTVVKPTLKSFVLRHIALVVSRLQCFNGKKWKKKRVGGAFLWIRYSAAFLIKTKKFIKENPSVAWATFLVFPSDGPKVSEWQQAGSTRSLGRYACVWMCACVSRVLSSFLHVCVHVQPAGSLPTCWPSDKVSFFFSFPTSTSVKFTNLSVRNCCCLDWSGIKTKAWVRTCVLTSRLSL